MFRKREVEAELSNLPYSHRSQCCQTRKVQPQLGVLFQNSVATLKEYKLDIFSAVPVSQRGKPWPNVLPLVVG
jgi:hypothetical protein